VRLRHPISGNGDRLAFVWLNCREPNEIFLRKMDLRKVRNIQVFVSSSLRADPGDSAINAHRTPRASVRIL
jgi:hypothetical protein